MPPTRIHNSFETFSDRKIILDTFYLDTYTFIRYELSTASLQSWTGKMTLFNSVRTFQNFIINDFSIIFSAQIVDL
jgi:hypothetical protein